MKELTSETSSLNLMPRYENVVIPPSVEKDIADDPEFKSEMKELIDSLKVSKEVLDIVCCFVTYSSSFFWAAPVTLTS